MVGVEGLAVAIRGPEASDGLVGKRHSAALLWPARSASAKAHSWVRSSSFPCFWASFAASNADRAPWISRVRRSLSPRLVMRPSRRVESGVPKFDT